MRLISLKNFAGFDIPKWYKSCWFWSWRVLNPLHELSQVSKTHEKWSSQLWKILKCQNHTNGVNFEAMELMFEFWRPLNFHIPKYSRTTLLNFLPFQFVRHFPKWTEIFGWLCDFWDNVTSAKFKFISAKFLINP